MVDATLSVDRLKEEVRLYLCDGKACSEETKQVCFTQGGSCKHTSHKEHAVNFHKETQWCRFPGTFIFYEGELQ